MDTKKEILERYVPAEALSLVLDIIERYPCHLKIVSKRATKHGDFRRYADGRIQITINNEMNPYRFLLTLVHEFAHLVTFEEYKNVKPHGVEWKQNFKMLMLPFLRPEIFPNELLAALASHLINPKASSDRDVNLSLAFRKYDGLNAQSLIFEIPDNSTFQYRNRTFIKVKKRRTKYECVEVLTDKKYIFHPHAEVELIK